MNMAAVMKGVELFKKIKTLCNGSESGRAKLIEDVKYKELLCCVQQLNDLFGGNFHIQHDFLKGCPRYMNRGRRILITFNQVREG